MSTYCDHFDPLFSDADDYFIGLKESQTGGGGSGGDGGYYRPSVSDDGTLSWIPSSGGMPPVAPQNIKGPPGSPGQRGIPGEPGPEGPRGETGSGFTISGYYPSLSALEAAVPAPETGAAYGVGISAPYDIYVWDADHTIWKNNGPLQGPPGSDGQPGTPGKDGTSVSITSITPSTESGGESVVVFSDGKSMRIRNGIDGLPGTPGTPGKDGTSVSITSITPSTESGGESVVVFSDGKSMRIRNGIDGLPGTPGDKGDTGATGTTYTPAVSSAGVLSWTNDGGKANPQSVDLVAAVLAALPNGDGVSY